MTSQRIHFSTHLQPTGFQPAEMNTSAYHQLLRQCVHCGLCLESCPTYLLFGTEMDSPRGRIALMRAAAEGRIERSAFLAAFQEHITLCLECRACESACPSGVQYGKLVEGARIALEAEREAGWMERQVRRVGLQTLMPNLKLFKSLARLLRIYQKSGLQFLVRTFNLLPWRLQNLAELLPPISSSHLKAKIYPAVGQKRGTIAFFTGCVQEAFLGRINAASVRVLQRNGFEVHIPAQQTCCGAAQWHTGDQALAIQLARQNIDTFLGKGYDAIINNAGGCGFTLQEYRDLLAHDEAYRGKAQEFASKVKDFSQFLEENLLEAPLGKLSVRAVYSDSCHLRHGQKVIDAPRHLLQLIPGLERVEMKNPERCCGSAGVYNIALPEPANAILDAKIEDIATTNAQLVVTSNTGCHMQLVAGVRRAGLSAQVMHIAEVLDYAYRAESRLPAQTAHRFKSVKPAHKAPSSWLAWLEKRRKPHPQNPALLELKKTFQPGQVLDDPLELLTYEQDASNDRALPDAVFFPCQSGDVQKAVEWCSQNGVPLVARGAGSGLAGNAVAEHGGLILEFSQMKKLVALDLAGRTVTVQPGMITQSLDDLVKPYGLSYPPDPASGKVSTLGANISLNSGGPHCFKYGVTTNYVLGMEVVLADGQRLNLGGKALDAPGYDLTGLLTGGEGTLGIITQATLALRRRTPAVRTLMAAFDSLEQAGDAVSALIARGLVPATMELMDQRMMCMVEDFVHAGLPIHAEAALILETDGYAQSVIPQMEEIIEVLQQCGVKQMQLAENETQREKIWYARKSGAGAIARMAPAEYTIDATVPRSKMAQALKEVSRICSAAGLQVGIVAHAGDGNLHPMILIADPDDLELMQRVHQAGRAICDYCTGIGGSITGEHGVGIEKREFMSFMFTSDELAAMQQIKNIFDPENLLNPGKIFPTTPLKTSARLTPKLSGSNFSAPHSTEEAALAIKAWFAQGKSIRIQSGVEKANAETDEAILCTQNLSGILEDQPQDLYVRVGAGTRLADLQTQLASHGMWLPLVSPWQAATMGGIVAANFNAPLRMRYGGLRDLVLAMTVVLPDGRILKLGRPVVKNVAGYDLLKLFIGAHGSLGLIADITFKVSPQPRSRVNKLLPVHDLEQGLAWGSQICADSITASAVLLVKNGVQIGENSPYSLLYTLEGYPADVEAETVKFESLTGALRAIESPSSGSEVWADWIRNKAQEKPLYRIGVPAGKLPALFHSPAIDLCNTGNWAADLYNALIYFQGELPQSSQKAIASLDGYTARLNGPFSAASEPDIPERQPEVRTLMHKIKTTWDPQGLFNR